MSAEINVSNDLQLTRTYVKEHGPLPALEKLEAPCMCSFVALITLEWSVILWMWWPLYSVTVALLPVALIVVGTRQRAINNFLHDAAHRHLTKHPRLNDLIGECLLVGGGCR
jgi:fatty acid desaturase